MAPQPLLDLPPELRARIFELVLIEAQPIKFCNQPPDHDFNIPQPRQAGPAIVLRAPTLLHTSRQIWQEASKLYYGGNTFGVARRYRKPGSIDVLATWLRVLEDEDRMAVRTVRLEIGRWVGRYGELTWRETLEYLRREREPVKDLMEHIEVSVCWDNGSRSLL